MAYHAKYRNDGGERQDSIFGTDITAGQPKLITTDLWGVASEDVPANAVASLIVSGTFQCLKKGAVPISNGDMCSYDVGVGFEADLAGTWRCVEDSGVSDLHVMLRINAVTPGGGGGGSTSDQTDRLTIASGGAALTATPINKVFGTTSTGDAVQEDDHFSVAGTALTAISPVLADGTKVTLHYQVATSTPVSTRQGAEFDTADGTAIDLDTTNEVKIMPTNTNTVFTASGGYTDLKVKNAHGTNAITVNGFGIGALETKEICNFGSGWEEA